MHIVGYDAKVAAAHGYVIKKTAAGVEYSVKANATTTQKQAAAANAVAATISPDTTGVVEGNCGESWVTLTHGKKHAGSLSTGFDVIDPAVYYDWCVSVIDQNGASVEYWGPSAYDSAEWSGSTGVSLSGYATAQVESDSYVVLVTGAECTSGGPEAHATFASWGP